MGGNYSGKTRSEIMRALWQTADFRAKMFEANSKNTKKRWQNPEYRDRMLTLMRAPEALERAHEGRLKAWTPDRCKKFADAIRERYRTDPEYAAKVRASVQRATEVSKKQRRQPEYLRSMTKKEREYYDLLVRKGRFSKAEALEKLGEQRRVDQSKAAAD